MLSPMLWPLLFIGCVSFKRQNVYQINKYKIWTFFEDSFHLHKVSYWLMPAARQINWALTNYIESSQNFYLNRV